MAQRRPRRRFTREYKAQAVQRLIESGRPLAGIASELDVSPGQLSQWRNEQLAAGSAEALAQTKADEAELLRLRREVKRLEDENLILRKAAAFFARGSRVPGSALSGTVVRHQKPASRESPFAQGSQMIRPSLDEEMSFTWFGV